MVSAAAASRWQEHSPPRGAAIAFVFWFLPETKGLPVEEIVRVVERQRGTLQPVTALRE